MSPVSLSMYDRWRTRAADDDGQGERPLYPGECRECDAEPCPRHAYEIRKEARRIRAALAAARKP